jgi:hemerythrin superfamily protein
MRFGDSSRKEERMTTTPESQIDIVNIVLEDHRTVQQLFERFNGDLDLNARDGLFRELTTVLVRHEFAEEDTVYPALRKLGEQGEWEADSRIHEESEAEELLRSMEQMDVMGEQFELAFHKLLGAVSQHAQNEETEVLPLLRESTSAEDRRRMGERYMHAKQSAPSHPHPHLPDSPPGNRITRPIAAIADRIRDAFQTVPGSGGQT